MKQAALRVPCLAQYAIQRAQGEAARFAHRIFTLAAGRESKHARRLQISGDAERVPAYVDSLVDVGNGTAKAGRIHFLLCRIDYRVDLLARTAGAGCDFLGGDPHPKHVLGMVVVHLAHFFNVIVKAGNFEFVVIENRAGLVPGPGEVIAVVVQVDVGVLRGVKSAAFTVAQPLVHPAHDVARDVGEEQIACRLVAVDVVLQQLRVVVGHLFEMRNAPAFIDGIAMKAACQLIVDAAARHLFQRRADDGSDLLFSGAHIPVDE